MARSRGVRWCNKRSGIGNAADPRRPLAGLPPLTHKSYTNHDGRGTFEAAFGRVLSIGRRLNETTRFHQSGCWRGIRVARCSARAAAGDAGGRVLVANNTAYDALDDRRSLEAVLDRMPLLSFDRRSRSKVVATFMKGILSSPYLSFKALGWLRRKTWRASTDLWAARGRVNKLSFVIHNFMDACRLERDRVDACSFMAMTQRGPISMCLHNAKRDAFILAPVRLSGPDGERVWNPLSGEATENPTGTHSPLEPNRKSVKGRLGRAKTATVSVDGEIVDTRQA
jgi:hypothetical protein